MEFRILGPLDVTDRGQPVELTATAMRRLLAVLLCHANEVVPAARLAGYTAVLSRKALQVQVHRLRRALGEHHPITYRPPGYVLKLASGELDADRFEELAARGRDALAAGDDRLADTLLGDALALWRGQALAGLDDVDVLREEAARLTELRLGALQDRVDAELRLGRHVGLVTRLTRLVAEHPLRERLRAQLMLALYRAGRQAHALQVYQDGRRILVDELGIEPGPELRRLHRAILAADPALDHGDRPAVPRGDEVAAQLPRDIADFTGREDLVDRLVAELTPDPGADPAAALAVSMVSGRGGVGKTTLAVHVAHLLRPTFTDGQLYVNLAGTTAEPAEPVSVLARFLRALGVDSSAIPDGVEERAELYRQRLAGRRTLVVLDDAASEAQVGPLLPGSPTCGVIVTGRAVLACLAGSRQHHLDGFRAAQAVELLGRLAGTGRVSAEVTAAARIAELCGFLPLAIRVAGARLAARPDWPLARLTERLADARRRLDVLATGDLAVRACFALSYRALPEPARHAFRLLGTLDVPDFAAWVVAALLDIAEPDGEALVDVLVDAQLLDVGGTDATGQLRYRFHDLVRVFARERAEAEDGVAARAAAFGRAAGAWLALAEAANHRLPAQTLARVAGTADRWRLAAASVDALTGNGLGWFDAEHYPLRSVLAQAARDGLAEVAWELADATQCYDELRDRYDEGQHTHRLALDACRRAGNGRGEAVLLRNLASLWTAKPGSSREERRGYAEAALVLFRRHGERAGEADALCLCGDSYRVAGEHTAALDTLREAVAVAVAAGHPIAELHAWQQICAIHREHGDFDTAAGYAERCLALAERLGSSRDLGVSLMLLGIIRREQGDLPRSEVAFRAGIAACEAAGDHAQLAYLYGHLGQLYARLGHPQARATLDRAERLSRDRSLLFGLGTALHGLGELDVAGGDLPAARDRLTEAAALWQRSGHRFAHARSLKLLGGVHDALGERDAAAEAWSGALRVYEAVGNAGEVQELRDLLDARPR